MTRAARSGEAGITLIETLVVLSIIGASAGALMMGFGDRGRGAETEAVRLARHLTLGVDEALITGLPLSLQWDSSGYRFGQLTPGQAQMKPESWSVASLPVLGMRHDLAPPLKLRLRDETAGLPVVLPASGSAATVTFEIVGQGAAWTVTFDGFSGIARPEEQL